MHKYMSLQHCISYLNTDWTLYSVYMYYIYTIYKQSSNKVWLILVQASTRT